MPEVIDATEVVEVQQPQPLQAIELPIHSIPDTMYEVILNPVQLHTLHAGQVALVRMYSNIVNLIENNDQKVYEWMETNNMTPVTIVEIYENARQMLMQFDHAINKEPLPKDADPFFTMNLREAFEPFEQQ